MVGAVIRDGDKVLAALRPMGKSLAGYWEFPGGKVEAGEDPRAALRREIREELGCEVHVGDLIVRHVHDYPDATIALSTYWCTISDGAPTALEHAELRWITISELDTLRWPPADLPTLELLRAAL